MRSFAPILGICIVLTACGDSPNDPSVSQASPSSTAAAPEAAPSPPVAGASLLRLNATVKDEPFRGAPACMVTFTIENLHDKPLAVFSADFKPTQVSTGEELTTATAFAGLSASAANLPLPPAAMGDPCKQNVLGAHCSDVAVRFEGKFFCAFQGQPCQPADIEVQQQGLASVSGLRG